MEALRNAQLCNDRHIGFSSQVSPPDPKVIILTRLKLFEMLEVPPDRLHLCRVPIQKFDVSKFLRQYLRNEVRIDQIRSQNLTP